MLQQSQTTSVRKLTKKIPSDEPDRSSFLRLTLAERRKVMREQARKLLDCYTRNTETTGMGGGDFIDTARLVHRIGKLDHKTMREITEALAAVVEG